jgi:hypothetical protein
MLASARKAGLNEFRSDIHTCFFGHIHSYERKVYREITLIVTGAGGAVDETSNSFWML